MTAATSFAAFTQEGLAGGYYTYATAQQNATTMTGVHATSTSIDTTPYVPSVLSNRTFGTIHDSGDSESAYISNVSPAVNSATKADQVGAGTWASHWLYWEFRITSNTLYWISSHSSGNVWINGFKITAL